MTGRIFFLFLQCHLIVVDGFSLVLYKYCCLLGLVSYRGLEILCCILLRHLQLWLHNSVWYFGSWRACLSQHSNYLSWFSRCILLAAVLSLSDQFPARISIMHNLITCLKV